MVPCNHGLVNLSYNCDVKSGLRELVEIAELMEEHFLKPERANGTCWVEHKTQSFM